MKQIRNVAAEIVRDLRIFADAWITRYPKEAASFNALAATVNTAVKFQLPEGGRLLERQEGYWSVTDDIKKTLHLPFSVCLFIFNQNTTEPDKQRVSESIAVLCIDIPEHDEITCVPIQKVRLQNNQLMWLSGPVGFSIQRKNHKQLHESFAPENLIGLTDKGDALAIKFMMLNPAMHGTEETELLELINDSCVRIYVGAVIDVLKVMQCSNVTSEPIAGTGVTDAVNAKRIRNGKLPLYEYRQLTVDVSGSSKEAANHYGSNGSKRRQHLRRGHIRNYQSGLRIWVQSCIVGSGELGQIDKEYKLMNRSTSNES